MTTLPDVEAMAWPAKCRHCGHIHDGAKVEVVDRYTDCSVWRCPNCTTLIDDRPEPWGGCMTGPAVKEFVRSMASFDVAP